MDSEQNIEYLFDVSKTVKHFYETPVIFVTKQDYSDNVFNTMCVIRAALQRNDNNEVIDAIADFHLKWLHAVNEMEMFKKRVNGITKEEMFQVISFTIDAMGYRLKYYQKYMETYRSSLPNSNQANLIADIEIVEEMHKDVTRLLLEKLKCFRNFVSNDEFKLKVHEATDELLQWLDKINDELASNLSKYMPIHMPHLRSDLNKTLQQIVDELQTSSSMSAFVLLEDLKNKGRDISSMIRGTSGRNLEIRKVVEKIEILEDRIQRLEHEPLSAAVMALKNKKQYLERRLSSLENLRVTLKSLHTLHNVQLKDVTGEELCECEDFFQFKIFNHSLPAEERERLVTELCYLWDLAVFGEKTHKSMISILSAVDLKEEFTDELGTFFIDEHSRKIYKVPDDETLYQPNEINELVPVADDPEHVYFYDECGRYFIDNKTRQRVYKAHASASEYLMDSSGVLLKMKEERDGITFYYDNYGRYYINEEGKHIYKEVESISEYENDGFGNLVRIRSHLDLLEPCPDDVHVTDEYKYLIDTVGLALRKCVAKTILYQPYDPIKYLSIALIKYRQNIEGRNKRDKDKQELYFERETRQAEERIALERENMAADKLSHGGSEASYDSNLIKYTSQHQDDSVSVGVSGSNY